MFFLLRGLFTKMFRALFFEIGTSLQRLGKQKIGLAAVAGGGISRVVLDPRAIANDPQIVDLLEAVADELVLRAEQNTRVQINPRRGPVEMTPEGPQIIIGAKSAAAVSVEFGTRYRYASRPFQRAAQSLGVEIGD